MPFSDHFHCPRQGCYWRIQYAPVCSRCGGPTVQQADCCPMSAPAPPSPTVGEFSLAEQPTFVRIGNTTVGRCNTCSATDYVSNFVTRGCSYCKGRPARQVPS